MKIKKQKYWYGIGTKWNIGKNSIEKYKKYYVEHIEKCSDYYESLAKKNLGHSVRHTLLIHHSLLNALFLEDLIQMYKKKGWKIISAQEAFRDPIFERMPKTVPAGESLLWMIDRETGKSNLRYPAEGEKYEKDAMDQLGLW